MFSIFSGRHSSATLPFKQELARLIADNLGSRSRTVRTDEIAQMIIEQTYSFEGYVYGAYDLLVDQHGPCLIAPIVFTLATKRWKIEHSYGLKSIVYHQIPRHGFQVAEYICQCFNHSTWLNLRNSFVQGPKTNNGYVETTYGSPESAGRVADKTRYFTFWIAANGLTYFLNLTRQNARSYFTSENAGILRVARGELLSFPNQDNGMKSYCDGARADCISAIDDWVQR
jgi:hypothetical protein